MNETLTPEILDAIEPFTGVPNKPDDAAMDIIAQGNALQQVKTEYTTAVAVQKPRSLTRFTNNVLEEAKLAGAAFYYGWTAKGGKDGKTSKIEGPSIDLAMCMARNYGNCAIDVGVAEHLSRYEFKGVFIDLESGFTCPRLFRQRKSQNIGMKDQDRAEDITFQIGQSKAIRNAIVRAMPDWLISQAIETAKQAELNKIKPENLALARAKVLAFFAPYGITQERIEAKVGVESDKWTPSIIVELRGSATALKEGRISADELFPAIEKDAPKQETSAPPPQESDGLPDWWNLKSKGWGEKYNELSKEEWQDMSPYLQNLWRQKCERMGGSPWPRPGMEQAEEEPAGEGEPPPFDPEEKETQGGPPNADKAEELLRAELGPSMCRLLDNYLTFRAANPPFVRDNVILNLADDENPKKTLSEWYQGLSQHEKDRFNDIPLDI